MLMTYDSYTTRHGPVATHHGFASAIQPKLQAGGHVTKGVDGGTAINISTIPFPTLPVTNL